MRILLIGLIVVSACSARNGLPDSTFDTPHPIAATPEIPSTATRQPEQPGDFEYSSVADALADLKARKGVSIAVQQGWTIAAEPDGLTTWSFAPSDHPAYPAVAKRVLYRDQDGWHLKMDVLCEAEKADCEQFVIYFESLNESIYRMIEQQQGP